jgi:hypothetical protein
MITTPFLIDGLGSFAEDQMEESEDEPWVWVC